MPLDKIRAPFGFVPLSEQVVFPGWADRASQDWPFEDGLRGEIELDIEAVSPTFVRGTDTKEESFRDPDGRFGIPGASLRGMLRNTVEIASFGKLNRFDRRTYGVRDLHNRDLYGRHMADVLLNAKSGKKEPMPLVNAGWLVPGDDEETPAFIEPCDFAKIEYQILTDLAQSKKVARFNPGVRQSSVQKYQQWVRPDGTEARLSGKVAIGPIRDLADNRIVSAYGKVLGPGSVDATIVFTGQPSPYDPSKLSKRPGAGNPKHHDFVFYGSPKPRKAVSKEVFRDFEFIHSDGGQQDSLTRRINPNEEWGFWRKRSDWDRRDGKRETRREVPVFFLLDTNGKLRAFGLAMMFRLAYTQSVKDAVKAGQSRFDDDSADLAETLFGHVPDNRNKATKRRALKGRVSVSFAPASGVPKPMQPVTAVLGAPKASYYPIYLEQNPTAGHGLGPSGPYKTFMDAGVRIRGWKRYRPVEGHKPILQPTLTKGDGSAMSLDRVGTRFAPLPPGTQFRARIRLHNVLREEAGALLWAIDYGGEPNAFHKLGLARSLGYGTVKLRTGRLSLVDMRDQPVTAADCVAAFERWMREQLGVNLRDTPQIRELIALAKPMAPEDARHMQLKHINFGNEFIEAKRGGLVLAPASGRLPSAVPHASPQGPTTPAPRVAVSPIVGALWSPLAPNTVIHVALTDQNKNGKWRFTYGNAGAGGTVIQGTPPEGAAAGAAVEVEVVRGATKSNIEAKWRS